MNIRKIDEQNHNNRKYKLNKSEFIFSLKKKI